MGRKELGLWYAGFLLEVPLLFIIPEGMEGKGKMGWEVGWGAASVLSSLIQLHRHPMEI